MLETLKFGEGNWANKTDSTLAYSDQYGNFKAIPFDFTRTTTATRVNKQGLIESVNGGIARIDYSDSTQGALLLEPQRTNLVPFSNEFSNSAWEKTNSSITSNATISPDGTQNADKVVESATLSYTRVRDSFNFINGQDYTFSIFAKADERDFVKLEFNTSAFPTNTYAWFDLTNKTATSPTVNNGLKIEDYGNGWFRCSMTATADATIDALCAFYISDSINTTYQGDGVSGLYIYGAQLEKSSYLTSYIPTNGTTATRNQELCVDAASVINSEEGVLYAEISALANDGTNRFIFISDGTNDNGVRLYYTTVNNRITARYYVNGTATSVINFNLPNALDFNKIAFRYKENDFSLWANGSKVGTDTLGATNPPNTLTNLSFATGVGASPFFGNTKGLKLYNTALTDAQLQTLTTI